MSRENVGHLALVTAVLVALAALASPSQAQEAQLAGVSLGERPDDLLSSPAFGTPDAMFTSGNVFNFVKAQGSGTPPWAGAVRMAALTGDQVQWLYNRDPVVIGFVITGTGPSARVTDIVVSQWRNFNPSKVAETEKGMRLGDTFADVLEAYGWPNRMEIISEQGGAGAAASTPAPGGIAPGALGGFTFRFSSGGEESPAAALGPAAPAGPGPLPPVGGPLPPTYSTTAEAGPAGSLTFTKSCVMSYPAVDFVIYRMQVFRIHVYGR